MNLLDPAQFVLIWALALCRVGGCLLVLPGLSNERIPAQVRILLVAVLSLGVSQWVWQGFEASRITSVASLLLVMFQESVLGVFLGLAVRFYLLALSFIANAIGFLTGYGNLLGPGLESTDPQAALGTLVTMSALVIIFLADFHHGVIRGLVGSYDIMPVATRVAPALLLENLTDSLTESFFIVLRLGSPFFAYALIVNLMVGILNKLTPQIPIYFVSMPFLIFGGLLLLYFTLPTILTLYVDGLRSLPVLR